MYAYLRDQNIVVTVLTSSGGEFIVKDGNSGMAYRNFYI